MAATHRDVEFEVETPTGVKNLKDWGEAAGLAIALSASTGSVVQIDVLVWSEAGARAWEGDTGVEKYREDPDASVFERIEISAEAKGRIA